MGVDTLYAWKDYAPVARFMRVPGGVRLEYAPGVSTPLSVSLPIGIDNGLEKPGNWLKNLLPNNKAVWRHIAEKRNVTSKSIFDLLATIGSDLPGDIVLTSTFEQPEKSTVVLEKVDTSGIEHAIADSKEGRTHSLTKFGTRLSLAGMQDKFSLSYVRGSWYTPSRYLPSTHIFKPGHKKLKEIEKAEAFAQTLAKVCGVRAADGFQYQFGSQTSYVTTRFDRVPNADGSMHRVPMEDFSQLMGIGPDSKYSMSLRNIFDTLRTSGMANYELRVLLNQIIFNVLIGNADAHSKNYSILLVDGIKVAPLYDSIPTEYYSPMISSRLAMPIGGAKERREIADDNWASFGSMLGISRPEILNAVNQLKHQILSNAETVGYRLEVPEEIIKTAIRF